MKLTARIKSVPKLTANFKELKMPLSGGFEEGYEQGYAAGYEDGKPQNGAEYVELDGAGVVTKARIYGRPQPYQFYQNAKLVDVEFAEGVTIIPNSFFYGCTSLPFILPTSVTVLEAGAYREMKQLQYITLHEGLKSIGNGTFYNTKLVEVTLPSTVETIDHNAFGNISTLKTVTFLGTPKTIGTCFSSASGAAITDIYVPWSEGAVKNAPWGAVNAIIHYNSEVR